MNENKININWFPGHMAKAIRQIKEINKLVDVIIEIIDARAPFSTRHPLIAKINKPRLIIISKIDLADEKVTNKWIEYFTKKGIKAIPLNIKQNVNDKKIIEQLNEVYYSKDKKLLKRNLRAVVVGVPNVGKSTFINKLSNRSSLKAEDRPGVTRALSWVRGSLIDLLDTPGILWPKFESDQIGLNLGLIGSIKETILPQEELVKHLLEVLIENYFDEVKKRYKLNDLNNKEDLIYKIGLSRNFLVSGGEVDYERTITTILNEFKNGVIGNISLEMPNKL